MGSDNFEYVKAFIRKWEGKSFVNDPDDKGGATKWGVTLKTFQKAFGKNKTAEDLKNITEEQWDTVCRKYYYDKMHADEIENKSIALLCVQMCWGSGTQTAIKKIQNCLGCKADGVVGPITLGKLNAINSADTFRKLWSMRYVWLCNIASVGNNKKFLRGWLNRLNDIKYQR